jgi:hypothetical protein
LKKTGAKISRIAALAVASAFFAMCTKPSYVLSDKKMENVLFDLYIAEAEINDNYPAFSNDSLRKRELLNSVLKKHKINQETLDTSLVWYSAHLEKYLKLNEKLEKRYTEILDTLQTGNKERRPHPDADSLLQITAAKNFLLTGRRNFRVFPSDSAVSYYGGNFRLQARLQGIRPEVRPIVSFRIECTDSTYLKRDTITQDGLYTATLNVLPKSRVKAVTGAFYRTDTFPSASIVRVEKFEVAKKVR